jgi:DNA-binding transcriptional MerR regulator
MNGTEFFSSGEVADTVGISRWKFLYHVERGDLPGPTHTVAGRRLFTAEDIEQIRQAWQARKAQETK